MLREKADYEIMNFENSIGGASRDRTDDLIVANDALSQLSYSPTPDFIKFIIAHLNLLLVPTK